MMNNETMRQNDPSLLLSGPLDFVRNKAGAVAVLAIANATLSFLVRRGGDSTEPVWLTFAILIPTALLSTYGIFLCLGVLANSRAIVSELGAVGRVLNRLAGAFVVLAGAICVPAFFSWFATDSWVTLAFTLVGHVVAVGIAFSIPTLLIAGFMDFWRARRRLRFLDGLAIALGFIFALPAIGIYVESTAALYTSMGSWYVAALQVLGVVLILAALIIVPLPFLGLYRTQKPRPHWRVSPVATAVFVATLVLGVGGTLYGWQSIKHERVHLKTQVDDDIVYLPPPSVLKMSSLGYGPTWGDMLFVRTHAYYLRHMYGDQIFRWLETYSDAVINLDPDNREIYYWASQVVRYGQTVSEEIIARSNQFAEKGLERFPDDARLYAHVGFNLYFELRPMLLDREQVLRDKIDATSDPAERDRALDEMNGIRRQRIELEEQALVHYTTAAMLPHSTVDPVFLFDLYIKQDQTEAAVHIARSLYFDVSPQNRAQLLERLKIAGRDTEASELQQAEEMYKEEMPFISPELYRMVGSANELTVPQRWDRLGEFFEALDKLRSPAMLEGDDT